MVCLPFCATCVVICLGSRLFFFFKQKTAYEMRISDWSSDVCSSDLPPRRPARGCLRPARGPQCRQHPAGQIKTKGPSIVSEAQENAPAAPGIDGTPTADNPASLTYPLDRKSVV